MYSALKILFLTALLFLVGCAGSTTSCTFCGASTGYIHGYPTSKGPRQTGGQFVDENQTRYVDGPAHVIGYFNSKIYCSSSAWIEGFDRSTIYASRGCHARGYGSATIYYRDGADVSVHEHARAFRCPQSQDGHWDTSQCVETPNVRSNQHRTLTGALFGGD